MAAAIPKLKSNLLLSQLRRATYQFKDIKDVTGEIRRINQENMELASEQAKETASVSLVWFTSSLVVGAIIAGLLAWHMIRNFLLPIQSITESAKGISEGNLDQVVPILSSDEIGQLAQAFNLMARHLREFRQSQSVQLVRAQKTSQATIDSFPDPVLVIDIEGNVEMANPSARRLLGVIPRHADLNASGTWHPPEPLKQPLADALQGKREYLPEGFDQVILLPLNDRERALLPRIIIIRDAEQNSLGAAVLLEDVTRLRLLDQIKSNLVATASHELKTPLTSLRLVVHLLLEESAGPLTPKQTELLLDARENSERLLAVINNLLDLARLEQGWRQLDVRPVSPRSLLQAAVEYIHARAQDKNVGVELNVVAGLPAVSIDAERMGHALRNLLDNALTYTDPGGCITLGALSEGDRVVLSVADTGHGIPADHLPHLFEKFFRVPGRSSEQGTGLGLAIVYEIVSANGGTIDCQSTLGVGTIFRIKLPIALSNPITSDLPSTMESGVSSSRPK